MAKNRTVRNTTSPPSRSRSHEPGPQAAEGTFAGRLPKAAPESDRRSSPADDGARGWAEALMDCYDG